MGQYFTYGLASGEEGIKPRGLKMMEHSYIFNESVSMLYYLLCDESYREFIHFEKGALLGSWRHKPVVHCGDYTDIKRGDESLYDHLRASSVDFMERLQLDIFGKVVSTSKTSLFVPEHVLEESLDRFFNGMPLYVLNHTKNQVLDVRAHIFMHRVLESKDGEVFGMLDPLSLLLVETDSGGGGDYEGEYCEMVGAWSQDDVEIVKTKPLAASKYKDVTLDFYFSEASELFESGHLSLKARSSIYARYQMSFGRFEVKRGKNVQTFFASMECDNLCDMIEQTKWLVKRTRDEFQKERALSEIEAEVIQIDNDRMTLATVDASFNYKPIGTIRMGKDVRIGDVVKVTLDPLRLVGN